jgi:hypothetical protein
MFLGSPSHGLLDNTRTQDEEEDLTLSLVILPTLKTHRILSHWDYLQISPGPMDALKIAMNF